MVITLLCQEVKLTHLSFANDILIFTNGTPQSTRGTLKVFDKFGKILGMCINVRKYLLFVAGCGAYRLEEEVPVVGISIKSLLIRYLGLPLTTKIMTRFDYEPLARFTLICWVGHVNIFHLWVIFNL